MSSAPETIALMSDPQRPAAVRAGGVNVRLRPLFRKHYDSVWRLLRRFGVPAQVADDAAQEVFLILAERMADVKEGSERSFMYGTALRLASSWRRTRDREMPRADSDQERALEPNAEELTDQKRARAVFDAILGGMDESLRTTFVLYEVEGLTVPEIADVVGLPLGTAASRLRRARHAFRAAVQRLPLPVGKE